jgi:hypothetical protein
LLLLLLLLLSLLLLLLLLLLAPLECVHANDASRYRTSLARACSITRGSAMRNARSKLRLYETSPHSRARPSRI